METRINGLLTIRSINQVLRVTGIELDQLTVYDLYYFKDRIFFNRYCTNKVRTEITDLLNTFGLLDIH